MDISLKENVIQDKNVVLPVREGWNIGQQTIFLAKKVKLNLYGVVDGAEYIDTPTLIYFAKVSEECAGTEAANSGFHPDSAAYHEIYLRTLLNEPRLNLVHIKTRPNGGFLYGYTRVDVLRYQGEFFLNLATFLISIGIMILLGAFGLKEMTEGIGIWGILTNILIGVIVYLCVYTLLKRLSLK